MRSSKTVPLGEVAEFIRGITFKPTDVVPVGTPESVACLRTKNVQAELDLSDVWAVSRAFVKRKDQFLQAGDILVSSANSWNLVGKCCWVPELQWGATFGGFVSVLRANDNALDRRFLFHWFSSDPIQAVVRSFGQQTTNISNLNTKRTLGLELLLPPLPEQRRIAEVLDRAEALRAKRRATLAHVEALIHAGFLEMFGDPAHNTRDLRTVSLGNLGKWQSGGTPPRERKDYFVGAVPWFSSGELNDMYAVFSKEYVSEAALAETSAKSVAPGSLMLGMYDTAALKASIAGVPCSCNQAVAFATINPETADTIFVYYSIMIGREHFRRLQRGVRQKNLNLSIIRDIRIPLPPLSQQREFARRVEAVERLKAVQRASLAEMDALFASLQHRAFRSEL